MIDRVLGLLQHSSHAPESVKHARVDQQLYRNAGLLQPSAILSVLMQQRIDLCADHKRRRQTLQARCSKRRDVGQIQFLRTIYVLTMEPRHICAAQRTLVSVTERSKRGSFIIVVKDTIDQKLECEFWASSLTPYERGSCRQVRPRTITADSDPTRIDPRRRSAFCSPIKGAHYVIECRRIFVLGCEPIIHRQYCASRANGEPSV